MATTLFVIDDDDIFHEIMKITVAKFKSFDNIVHYDEINTPLAYLNENKAIPDRLPEAIFVDLVMPYKSGWMFLDALCEIYPLLQKKVSIYVVTVSVNQADEARSKRYPFVKEYLSKPVYGKKLVELYKSIAEV